MDTETQKYIDIDINEYTNPLDNWIGTSYLRYFPDEDTMISYYDGYEEESLDQFNAWVVSSIISTIDGSYPNQCPVKDSLEKMEQLNWVNEQCGKDFPTANDLGSLMQVKEQDDGLFIANQGEVTAFLKQCVSAESLANVDYPRC